MRICEDEGCERRHAARGYCGTHYRRSKHGADMNKPIRTYEPSRLCSVDGCEQRHQARGLCITHYFRKAHQARYYPQVDSPVHKCQVMGCEKLVRAKAYCGAHYCRMQKGMAMQLPVKTKTYKAPQRRSAGIGSKFNDAKGYTRVRTTLDKNGWELEHRIIMELKEGRELLSQENVHHLNGIKDDNRIENLELWTTSQPSGQRVEDMIPYWIEQLSLYGDVTFQLGMNLDTAKQAELEVA